MLPRSGAVPARTAAIHPSVPSTAAKVDCTTTVVIRSETLLLKPDDCVHFSCEQRHMGKNIGDVPARLLIVVTPVNSLEGG